jgi:hypothetical protein
MTHNIYIYIYIYIYVNMAYLCVSCQFRQIVIGKKTPWPESRRLSAKLVPTFADRGFHVISVTDLRLYSRFSRQEPLLFYQVAPQLYSRG